MLNFVARDPCPFARGSYLVKSEAYLVKGVGQGWMRGNLGTFFSENPIICLILFTQSGNISFTFNMME